MVKTPFLLFAGGGHPVSGSFLRVCNRRKSHPLYWFQPWVTTTRSKDATNGAPGIATNGARTLLGAKGIATSFNHGSQHLTLSSLPHPIVSYQHGTGIQSPIYRVQSPAWHAPTRCVDGRPRVGALGAPGSKVACAKWRNWSSNASKPGPRRFWVSFQPTCTWWNTFERMVTAKLRNNHVQALGTNLRGSAAGTWSKS